jgi:hypothetical protein
MVPLSSRSNLAGWYLQSAENDKLLGSLLVDVAFVLTASLVGKKTQAGCYLLSLLYVFLLDVRYWLVASYL